MNPTIYLVTAVEVATEVAVANGATVVKTMEETGLMDRWWWWIQEGLQKWTSCR